MKKIFKRHRDYGFWDQDVRLSKLSQLGDPLERLNTCTMYEVRSKGVDFEMFRAFLENGLTKEPQGKGGRPPYDYVMMFKIMILQRYYNLSDDQVEFQINDRISFTCALHLCPLGTKCEAKEKIFTCTTYEVRVCRFCLQRWTTGKDHCCKRDEQQGL